MMSDKSEPIPEFLKKDTLLEKVKYHLSILEHDISKIAFICADKNDKKWSQKDIEHYLLAEVYAIWELIKNV